MVQSVRVLQRNARGVTRDTGTTLLENTFSYGNFYEWMYTTVELLLPVSPSSLVQEQQLILYSKLVKRMRQNICAQYRAS